MARKKLYKGEVREFCRAAGKLETYWTRAYSPRQATKQIAGRFNKKHGFEPWRFAKMTITEVKEGEKLQQ